MSSVYSSPPSWFIEMRRRSISVPTRNDYNHRIGECNLELVKSFILDFFRGGNCCLWEPFGGHTGKNKTIDMCAKFGVDLIVHDIDPSDERVIRADSTFIGPKDKVDGAIFHPPYFGSCVFSYENGELSGLDEDGYLNGLRRTVKLTNDSIDGSGCVCCIGSTVFVGGESVNMPWVMCSLFMDVGFSPSRKLYSSTPDWAVIMEKSK